MGLIRLIHLICTPLVYNTIWLISFWFFQWLQVYKPESPDAYAWQGAARYVRDELSRGTLGRSAVSRQEYLEHGHHYCNEKFAAGW